MKRLRSVLLPALLVSSALVMVTGAMPDINTGSWQPAGSMSQARHGASSVLLTSGTVLVSGGSDASGAHNSVELFGADATFTPAEPMTQARTDHASVALPDGRVLVIGGRLAVPATGDAPASSTALADAETFSAGAWTPVGSLNEPRWGHTATVLDDGRVVIAGGENAIGPVASVEIFDPASGQFTVAGTLSSPRKGHAAARLADGRVLLAGGFDGTSVLSSIDVFTPATGIVSTLGALDTPRAGLSATTLLDGRVLFFGGFDGTNELATSVVFNPATNSLSPGATGAVARRNHQAFLLPRNNAVLLVGGVAANTALTSTELYLPWVNRVWSTGDTGVARYAPTGSTLAADGHLLLAGGEGLASSEIYRFATVRTDMDDYLPGQTVYVSASGWQPNETVTFGLRELPAEHEARTFSITADENGNITNALLFVVEDHQLGVRFILTARGIASQAQITFTDGSAKVTGTVRSSASGTPVIPGATVACTAGCSNGTGPTTTDANGVYSLNVNFSGNSASISVTASATGFVSSTISGVTPSNTFDPSGINFSLVPNLTATTTTVSSSLNPSLFADLVTFTASVAPASGSVVPTGSVTFSIDGGPAQAGTSGAPVGTTAKFTYATSALTVGTHSVVATYTATGAFSNSSNAASPLSQVVNKANQATVTVTAPGSATYNQAGLVATGSGGSGTGAFSYSAGASTACTVGSATGAITVTSGTGTCAITATRAADANYSVSSPSAAANVTIGRASQTITFGALAGKTFGDLPFGVSATASSGLAVAFSAGALDACTVNVSTVTVTAAGSCTITATQAGDNNYAAAPAVPQTFVIAKATPSIQATGATVVYDGNPHPATGTATGVGGASLGPVTLTYTPGDANAPVNAGSYSVVASIAASANYNAATSAPATVTITQADAVVSVSGFSGVYDGNPHGATGTATGVKGESLTSLLNLGSDFTNVPGGTATWTFAGDTNYKSATGSVAIVITQADAVVNVSGFSGVYDGNAHGATGTATGVKGEPLTGLLNLGSSFTNVPGGSATWTFAGDTNYKSATGSVAIVITQADAVVNVSGFSGVYDGNPHGATGTATGVKGESLTGLLNLGSSFTNVPGGTATWTFAGDTNYKSATGSVGIVITQADAAVNVSGFSGVYDGNAHGATGTATGVKGEPLTSLLNLGSDFTNVPGGTATWTFAGDTNYKSATGSVGIVITQADAVVSVSGFSGVYDGNAHGATGTATGVKGEPLTSLLNLGSDFTNVPGGTATWTFAGDTNYKSATGSVAIVITQADAAVNVSGFSGVYDGNAHGATGTATGVKGEPLTSLLNLGSDFTNVPGGTATWTFAGDMNYKSATGSVAIVITQADAAVNVSGFSGVYDGYAHGATGTATGVKGEPLTSLLNLGSDFTNVPGGTATWTFAGDTNYKSATGSVGIVITQADAVVSVSGFTGVYNGNPHGATGTATGVKGESLTSSLNLGSDFTNVPGGTAHWTFASNNYHAQSGDVAITITKADPTVTVAGFTAVYDGSPHGATGTATGVGGVSLGPVALTYTLGGSAAPVNAGTYTVVASIAESANYNGASSAPATITINKADPTVTVLGFTVVYDGAAHHATGTATGAGGVSLGPVTLSYTPGGSAPVNSGPYSVIASIAASANYNAGNSTPATITIAKADPTVTVADLTAVYDGNTHGTTGSATGVGGLSLGPVVLTYTPGGLVTPVNAGSYSVVASVAASANYNAGTSAAGTVTINKAAAIVTVTGYAGVFDGNAHGATGSAKGVLNENLSSLLNLGNTFAGVPGGSAHWVFAGNTNYNTQSGDVAITINAWSLTGFYQPVTMTAGVFNTVKGGSTVPLKFNIYTTAAHTTEMTSLSDVSGFGVLQIGCGASGQEDPVDFVTTGGTSLRYDSQFIQNWQTPKGAGYCYRVTMTARDGSVIQALFKTK